ncbi:MAG: Holliday junction branch migration protein RuvA [Deltaproteobacteria bacterium]|jgi:Holliday junction DNA helicase RuvA|nr:Holliday junction branch migration protein RuvA [Deltaproteobacteria bacterium]
MIAYIEGRRTESAGAACVVVTGSGVGYEIFLPAHALAALPEKGGQVAFHTCLIVREDAQELYGFPTFEERQTFLTLTSISKVGAKTALAVLSLFRPEDLRRIVLEEDVLALTRVSGIGKKTAQHVFLELKYKLKVEDMPQAASLTGKGERPGGVFRDALDGLGNLGYPEEEVAPILRKILHGEPDLDVAGALRAALKEMAKRK